MAKGEHYRIKIKGRLDPRWSDRLGSLAMTHERGETTLSGQLVDQAALHGLLIRIRDLGLPLLLVERTEPMSGQESMDPDPVPARQKQP